MDETLNWTVSGAQIGSFSYTGNDNFVNCTADGAGFFAINGASFAGSGESLFFAFYDYDGPGTYEASYSTGGMGPSATVSLSTGHGYWLFYNRASDLSMIPTTCTLTVNAAGSDTRVEGVLSCAGMVAQITSPDYDDLDAAGLRPNVSVTATFSCEL